MFADLFEELYNLKGSDNDQEYRGCAFHDSIAFKNF